MKRLTFKPEFVPLILEGKKRFTSRWTSQRLVEGDIVAAVARNGKTPAFLVPAKDGFARLKITSVESKFWKDFTEQDANDCTVTRDWYMDERTPAEFDRIHKYGWELIEEKPV
jgi:hypothetical protein